MRGPSAARRVCLLVAVLAATSMTARGSDEPPSGVVVHGPGKQALPLDAFPAELPAFEQRTVTEGGALEPPLAFDADGSMFYPAWTYGRPEVVDTPTSLYRSDDDGITWTDATPQIAGVRFNDQGGDPYLYRDATSGRLFSMLYKFGGLSLAWTDDGGRTWGTPLHPVREPAGVTDYPKLWTSRAATPAGYVVHLCYNALYRLACQRSFDGGLTFTPAPTPYPEALPNYLVDGCWSFHAGWTVSAPDGTSYMPVPQCGELHVAVGRDNGLTWEAKVVASGLDPLGLQETRLAIDTAGNLYYLWLDAQGDYQGGSTPMLSISRDGGETWSASVDVGLPGLTAAKLPSIVAGDAGRIALFYVGSTVQGGFGASDEQLRTARWDAYTAFSLNALDASPVFATAMVNPVDDPLRRGACAGRCEPPGTEFCIVDCSLAGGTTQGMFDYLQLALHPLTGRVAASLVDLCTASCATGTADDPASFVGAVGVQTNGPSLYASG